MQIHVELLEEGSAAYRPTPAEIIGEHCFRLLGVVPVDEVWAFQPGQVVITEDRVTSAAERYKVAVSLLEGRP